MSYVIIKRSIPPYLFPIHPYQRIFRVLAYHCIRHHRRWGYSLYIYIDRIFQKTTRRIYSKNIVAWGSHCYRLGSRPVTPGVVAIVPVSAYGYWLQVTVKGIFSQVQRMTVFISYMKCIYISEAINL